MRFLDPKEEVYKIKITPLGKYLMAQGRFNPTYYAFFDDDVVYDTSFLEDAGTSGEEQNKTQERILDETPNFEGQTKFQGSETTIFTKSPNLIDEIFPGISEKDDDPSYNIGITDHPINNYYLQKPLAKSGNNADTAPFFTINMLTGSIKDAKLNGSGSSGYFEQKDNGPSSFISQIKFELQDEITIDNTPDLTITPTKAIENDELFDSFYVFQDRTKITYDKKELFLKLEEGNTEFLKENFDIEVFEVVEAIGKLDDGSTFVSDTNLKKLDFVKDGETVSNKNVEYYFNLLFDNEIDPAFYCKILAENKNKTKDIFSDNTFKCPDLEQEKFNLNIYNTDKDTTPVEKC